MLRFDNHADFNGYLEKIDAEMRRDNVPIMARQIQALSRISIEHSDMDFNISEAIMLNKEEILRYEGNEITRRIIDWFEEAYGERLRVNFLEGKSVAVVRGDPYLMIIPVFIGKVKFTYSVETLGHSGSIGEDGKTIVNIFDCLVGITEATIERVTRSEGFRLANELKANTYRFQKATAIRDFVSAFDVRTDLDSAAHHMVSEQSNFGISRWHSLQAAEKALKSVLSCQGMDYPRTHDLFQLIHAGEILGVSPLALNAVMCSPSVRYESASSTLDQAINAHHASLDICLDAAEHIAVVGQSKSDQRPEWAKMLD